MTPPAARETCPKCQTPRRPGAEFCPRCGHAFKAASTDEDTLPPVQVPPLPKPSRRQRWLSHPLFLGFAIIAFMSAIAAVAVRDWRVPLVILGLGVLVAVAMLLWELFD